LCSVTDYLNLLLILINKNQNVLFILILYLFRKANQKISELESEFKDQIEENINEYMLKITSLQNELQCEKNSRSMEIEEKIATISEKG